MQVSLLTISSEHKNQKNKDGSIIRSSDPVLWVTVICGLLISGLGFWGARSLENNNILAELESTTELIADFVQDEFNISVEILRGLKELHDSSDFVSRDEFSVFTGPYLQAHLFIQALEWVPRVGAQQQAFYEQRARNDGLGDFSFRKRSPEGEMVPMARRAEYFPAFYAEPLRGNKAALGFDLASSAKRLQTRVQSQDAGQTLATTSITPAQETARQKGFLLFMTVYSGESGQLVERRRQREGFMLDVFRIGPDFEDRIERLLAG